MPRTLIVPYTDDVDDESAAFAALGAIALHAVRVAGHLWRNGCGHWLGSLGIDSSATASSQWMPSAWDGPDAERCRMATASVALRPP